MNILRKFPDNVYFHILQYSGIKLNKNVFEELFIKCGNNFMRKICENTQHTCIIEYLALQYNEHELKHYLHLLSKCKCCKKHQMKKPHSFDDEYNIYTTYEKIQESPPCICACRHISRFICRAYHLT